MTTSFGDSPDCVSQALRAFSDYIISWNAWIDSDFKVVENWGECTRLRGSVSIPFTCVLRNRHYNVILTNIVYSCLSNFQLIGVCEPVWSFHSRRTQLHEWKFRWESDSIWTTILAKDASDRICLEFQVLNLKSILNCLNHHIFRRGICEKSRLWASTVVVQYRHSDRDAFLNVLIGHVFLRLSQDFEANYRPFERSGNFFKRTTTISPKAFFFIILVDKNKAFDDLRVCVDFDSSLIVIGWDGDGLALINSWVHPSKCKRPVPIFSWKVRLESSEVGVGTSEICRDAVLNAVESCHGFVCYCEIFQNFSSVHICLSLKRRLNDADLTLDELSIVTEKYEWCQFFKCVTINGFLFHLKIIDVS